MSSPGFLIFSGQIRGKGMTPVREEGRTRRGVGMAGRVGGGEGVGGVVRGRAQMKGGMEGGGAQLQPQGAGGGSVPPAVVRAQSLRPGEGEGGLAAPVQQVAVGGDAQPVAPRLYGGGHHVRQGSGAVKGNTGVGMKVTEIHRESASQSFPARRREKNRNHVIFTDMCRENNTSHGGWGDFFVRNRATSAMQNLLQRSPWTSLDYRGQLGNKRRNTSLYHSGIYGPVRAG